ncbi:MAG: aldehyde dehydrogenase family protein [Burkholderiales bacterium]|nr:aldehyde dehydrogenase family protein [Burkholderiales bacterium]MDE2456594.1 aldehyde dehydrogenase family protein [Burkholderiales bacterium]
MRRRWPRSPGRTKYERSGPARAGTAHFNPYDEDDISVPFGGVEQSGNGRDKALHALDEYGALRTA